MKIDILLATFNGEKYLAEQIDSILSQTISDWRLLIRDDGSSDQTEKIIQHYVKQFPYKIIHILDTDTNLGVTRNFERLMEHSAASYLMFCDQDDIWMSNKIEISLRKLQAMEQQYTVDIPLLVYGDLAVCDEEGVLMTNSFWKYQGVDPFLPLEYSKALVQNNATGNTMIFNRSLLQKALPFSQEAVMHDWWVALVALYLGKIDFIGNPTLLYRQHAINVSGKKGKNIFPMFKKVPFYCNTLKKNITQAKSFLSIYADVLTQEKTTVLQSFSAILEQPRINRGLTLVKLRFLTFTNLKDSIKLIILILCSKGKPL